MHIEILNPPPVGLIEQHVAEVAAVCYASQTKNNMRRVGGLVREKTLSPYRHWLLTVKIQGISIPCARQLLRHVHTVQEVGEPVFEGVTEMSRRYVSADGADFVIPPAIKSDGDLTEKMARLIAMSQDLYKEMRANGISKGDARYCLPMAMTTDVTVSANPEAWLAFCLLRITSHAQWEIRELAFQIAKLITPHVPILFRSVDWEKQMEEATK